MAFKHKGRRVLVTGGTGSVGQALVKAFAQSDYRVSFQYCQDGSTARQREKKFGAEPLKLDFEEDFLLPNGDFDVVINNAGINISDIPTHEVGLQNWNRRYE